MLSKRYIEENQVLERYLADRLSEQEREAFENYYIENPEILHDLQAVASIKMGTGLLRRSGELKTLTAQRPAPRWRLGLALAATLLIASIAATQWLNRGTSPTVMLAGDLGAFPTRLTVAAVYQVQRTRSDIDAVVALPRESQAIELRLRPGFERQAGDLRVELLRMRESAGSPIPVGAARKLSLDSDGFLTLYLDSARLRPGSYELKVSTETAGTGASRRSDDFLIEVNAPAP